MNEFRDRSPEMLSLGENILDLSQHIESDSYLVLSLLNEVRAIDERLKQFETVFKLYEDGTLEVIPERQVIFRCGKSQIVLGHERVDIEGEELHLNGQRIHLNTDNFN